MAISQNRQTYKLHFHTSSHITHITQPFFFADITWSPLSQYHDLNRCRPGPTHCPLYHARILASAPPTVWEWTGSRTFLASHQTDPASVVRKWHQNKGKFHPVFFEKAPSCKVVAAQHGEGQICISLSMYLNNALRTMNSPNCFVLKQNLTKQHSNTEHFCCKVCLH